MILIVFTSIFYFIIDIIGRIKFSTGLDYGSLNSTTVSNFSVHTVKFIENEEYISLLSREL